MSRTTFTEQTRAARAVCDKSTVIDCREMVPGFEDDAGEKACSKQGATRSALHAMIAYKKEQVAGFQMTPTTSLYVHMERLQRPTKIEDTKISLPQTF